MKLGNVQQALDILNPLLQEKCPVKLSLDILDVLNAIQPEMEKINKVKENLVNQYALVDEEGNKRTKLAMDGQEVYDFGENEEKINDEMMVLMNTDCDISAQINVDNFEDNAKIEPLKLKMLYDLGLLSY